MKSLPLTDDYEYAAMTFGYLKKHLRPENEEMFVLPDEAWSSARHPARLLR